MVPVTILSGFLGSGKTTVLQNILSNREGLRVGVIVNDMGAINVDHELTVIKQSDGVVSLANGCVCCVLRNDLSDEIRTMAATGNFDAIVVECSGIAEPRQLEAMFKEKFPSPSSTPPDSTAIPIPGVGSSSLPDKRTSSYIQANTTATTAGRDPASNLPYLDNLVTVVDSENFLERIQSDKRVGENAAFIAAENASAQDNRFIVDLLTDQIEVATTIVLNKVDLVTTESVHQLRSIVSQYNGKAILVEGQFGCVDLEHLVVTNRYTPTDFEDIGAGALGSSGTDYSGTISGSAGITSFVWRSARPFHPVRLHNLICTLNEASVIRMKGFVCVADSNLDVTVGHQQLYIALAGNHIRLHDGRECVRHHGKLPASAQVMNCVTCDGCSTEECGERASEVVVIGFGKEIKRVKELLNACLMTSQDKPMLVPTDPILPLPREMWGDAQKLDASERRKWVNIALLLSIFTIIWNVGEGVVSMYLGVEEESLSVISFGADSFIEVFSAMIVLWRLSTDLGGGDGDHDGHDHIHDAKKQETTRHRERVATFLIGCLLLVLAFGAIGAGIYRLEDRGKPEDGKPGIIISAVSLSFMFGLWYVKMHASVMLKSTTLESDAACSFGCIALSVVLLIGSGLYEADNRLWWVDAVCAIVLALFIGWEGFGMVRAASRKDFDGCGCVHNPSRLAIYLRDKLMTKDGALKSSLVKATAVLEDRMYTQSGGLPVSTVCRTKCYDCEDNIAPCQYTLAAMKTAQTAQERVTRSLSELTTAANSIQAELAALDLRTVTDAADSGSSTVAVVSSDLGRAKLDASLAAVARQLLSSTSAASSTTRPDLCGQSCCTLSPQARAPVALTAASSTTTTTTNAAVPVPTPTQGAAAVVVASATATDLTQDQRPKDPRQHNPKTPAFCVPVPTPTQGAADVVVASATATDTSQSNARIPALSTSIAEDTDTHATATATAAAEGEYIAVESVEANGASAVADAVAGTQTASTDAASKVTTAGVGGEESDGSGSSE